MVLPPHTLSKKVIETIREYTHAMARELKVIGLMNVQYAVKDEKVFVLEVNPRASRTVPFVSKAIGVPLAKLAAKVMAGKTLKELGFTKEIWPKYWAVKESVFPFNRFHGQDILLSPEMRSTGEVMGLDADRGIAYAKSQMAAGSPLPLGGKVFISVSDAHKKQVAPVAKQFAELGFELVATSGTAAVLEKAGLKVQRVMKLLEGRPNVIDLLKNKEIQLVINTPSGAAPREDEVKIRTTAIYTGTPIMTTLSGAKAAALRHRRPQEIRLRREDAAGISLSAFQLRHFDVRLARRLGNRPACAARDNGASTDQSGRRRIIAIPAWRLSAFAIRVNLCLAGKNRAAHFRQLRFHPVQQRFKFRARQGLGRTFMQRAVLVPAVIELVAGLRIGPAIQLRQGVHAETAGVAIGQAPRFLRFGQRLGPRVAAVVFAAQVHVKNTRRNQVFHARAARADWSSAAAPPDNRATATARRVRPESGRAFAGRICNPSPRTTRGPRFRGTNQSGQSVRATPA